MKEKNTCDHIECDNKSDYANYCTSHFSGGLFSKGDTYEQYQVIEQDFIDFIKIVPIDDDEHLHVHSPVLRDIIIRCCVQIEVFFKEWGKFECLQHSNLLDLYNKIDKKTGLKKGSRNWNFRDYFELKEKYVKTKLLHVRPMNIDMNPFDSWTKKEESPEWWNVYNSIKHDGINSKKKATLKIALESLCALFILHCANNNSKKYLIEYSNPNITQSTRKLSYYPVEISSPLDTKRYLFKNVSRALRKPIPIPIENSNNQGLMDVLRIKGKKV